MLTGRRDLCSDVGGLLASGGRPQQNTGWSRWRSGWPSPATAALSSSIIPLGCRYTSGDSPRPAGQLECSSKGSVGDAFANAAAESFVNSLGCGLIARTVIKHRIMVRAQSSIPRRLQHTCRVVAPIDNFCPTESSGVGNAQAAPSNVAQRREPLFVMAVHSKGGSKKGRTKDLAGILRAAIPIGTSPPSFFGAPIRATSCATANPVEIPFRGPPASKYQEGAFFSLEQAGGARPGTWC